MNPTKVCSNCNRELLLEYFDAHPGTKTGVTAHCKECRAAFYADKKYGTKCEECRKPKKLNMNLICRQCNHKSGLRECIKCKMMIMLFDFYDGKNTCKDCYGKDPDAF